MIVSILLLVCVVSLSYAFFTSQNEIGDLQDNKLDEQTATLNGTQLTLSGKSLEAEGVNVYPGHKEMIKLTVSALHDNGPVNYNLEWVGTNNLESEVTYKIYKSETEDLTPEITCVTKSVPGESMIQYYEECKINDFGTLESDGTYQEGTIVYANVEETQTLLYNEEITGNEDPKKVYYYIVIEYPNDPNKPQDDDAENSYSGHFKLNNITAGTKVKKVNTSIGVLEVNLDKPDFIKSSCKNGTNSTTHTEGNCQEETNGIYEMTTKLGTTYYYRGTVNNNWVKFGTNKDNLPIWWRIIRINEDKTIRLLYAGEGEQAPAKDKDGYWMGDSGINDDYYKFNDSADYNAYAGYMYGTPNSTSFDAEHGYDLIDAGMPESLQSSTIKQVVDEWYQNNLADEGSVLSGSTGFCGDRFVNFKQTTGFGDRAGSYALGELYSNKASIPTLNCTDSAHDLYTTKIAKGQGNGVLDYPIGLMTANEAVILGVARRLPNAAYGNWLTGGIGFWLNSPYSFSLDMRMIILTGGGSFNVFKTDDTRSVRPVVNVLPQYFNTEGQDGTIENPYIVQIN